MLLRLLPALFLLAAAEAHAQGRNPAQGGAPPALNRHGNWVEGQVGGGGREGCVAGTPAPGRGSLQVTVARAAEAGTVLVLAVRIERVTFAANDTVRFIVDGTTFELPGQAGGGGAAMLVAASTEEEARKISDLLVAMRGGRALRVQVGNRPALELSLTGASPALGAMRSCAQRVGMMPR